MAERNASSSTNGTRSCSFPPAPCNGTGGDLVGFSTGDELVARDGSIMVIMARDEMTLWLYRGTVKLRGIRLGRAEAVRYLSQMTTPRDPIYAGHRYPAELIGYAVWLYFRFPLSLRMVEEMLAARGISVTYETIRQWGLKFGREFANRIRRRAPRRGDKRHLDEVVITIAGTRYWLWPRGCVQSAVSFHSQLLASRRWMMAIT